MRPHASRRAKEPLSAHLFRARRDGGGAGGGVPRGQYGQRHVAGGVQGWRVLPRRGGAARHDPVLQPAGPGPVLVRAARHARARARAGHAAVGTYALASHGKVETPLPSNSPHYQMILGVDLVGSRTREVETPLPSNSPHDQMILGVDLVGSHGRWRRPCLQTAHMTHMRTGRGAVGRNSRGTP
jgi:hypothetical protein